MPRPKKSVPSEGEAQGSSTKQFSADAYKIVEMKRSELKSAEYNPRVMSDSEKKHLRAGLKKHKMVQPPTWNKRTGVLVGGHQRLTQLDALAGGKDYTLQVAVIDVSETEEKEINILLNNPSAMGDWDLGKLDTMLKDPAIDLAGAGFDLGDVYQLFGDMPGGNQPAIEQLANRLKEFQSAYSKISANEGRDDFYMVVVFRDWQTREGFLKTLEIPDNRYVDGKLLTELLAARSAVPAKEKKRVA